MSERACGECGKPLRHVWLTYWQCDDGHVWEVYDRETREGGEAIQDTSLLVQDLVNRIAGQAAEIDDLRRRLEEATKERDDAYESVQRFARKDWDREGILEKLYKAGQVLAGKLPHTSMSERWAEAVEYLNARDEREAASPPPPAAAIPEGHVVVPVAVEATDLARAIVRAVESDVSPPPAAGDPPMGTTGEPLPAELQISAVEAAAMSLLHALDVMRGGSISLAVRQARERLREAMGLHPASPAEPPAES